LYVVVLLSLRKVLEGLKLNSQITVDKMHCSPSEKQQESTKNKLHIRHNEQNQKAPAAVSPPVQNHACINYASFAESEIIAMFNRINSLVLPSHPLDDLVGQLGGSAVVSDLTGRAEELQELRKAATREGSASILLNPSSCVKQERQLFMEGKKRVAVVCSWPSSQVCLSLGYHGKPSTASSGSSVNAKKPNSDRVYIAMEMSYTVTHNMMQLEAHSSSETPTPDLYFLLGPGTIARWFAASLLIHLAALGVTFKKQREDELSTSTVLRARLLQQIWSGAHGCDVSANARYSVDALYSSFQSLRAKDPEATQWLTEMNLITENIGKPPTDVLTAFFNRVQGMPIDVQHSILIQFETSLKLIFLPLSPIAAPMSSDSE
jgi:hypothetical protein